MTDEPRCAKRVFSGERWDFGGHPCSRKGVVERDGRWWCKQHDPAAEAQREAKRKAEATARWDAEAARLQASKNLIERLGGRGTPHVSSFAHEYTGGIVLTEAEATWLAERLERAE